MRILLIADNIAELDSLIAFGDLFSTDSCNELTAIVSLGFTKEHHNVPVYSLYLDESCDWDEYSAKDMIKRIDPIVSYEKPDLIVVGGASPAALAGVYSAFSHKVPAGYMNLKAARFDDMNNAGQSENEELIIRLSKYCLLTSEQQKKYSGNLPFSDKEIFITSIA
ncbi:hypothetical protein [Jeotgalibacillus sp. JSM ZJ347]|uniref:hypothetical protein n=1 Tax=Jeotgalibacillus sp. JSM ZJ347 TaxID=3342117 RepID=UPI0035A86C13